MADSINQGGKFYICATPSEVDLLQAAFELLTWIEVEKIVTLPEISVTENIVESAYIDSNMVSARKGSKNGNESSVEVGFDYAATGQAAVLTAAGTKFKYPVKRELNDMPSGGSTNTITYSRALITLPVRSGGGVDDMVNDTFTLKVQQVPIEVLAT